MEYFCAYVYSMILFFRSPSGLIYGVGHAQTFSRDQIDKLIWLFGGAKPLTESTLQGHFVGPRKEMITPWSTNAVEITQTMGIGGISRIEEFAEVQSQSAAHDRMLQYIYFSLDQELFTINHKPEPVTEVADIRRYNEEQGLA